jgi:hypothetical protein
MMLLVLRADRQEPGVPHDENRPQLQLQTPCDLDDAPGSPFPVEL